MTNFKNASYYDVTIEYGGSIPKFSGRVYANDEAHAEHIAHYDAKNKGWPDVPHTCTTIKLKD